MAARSHDGAAMGKLYDLALDGRMMSVPVTFAADGKSANAGAPIALFPTRIGGPGIMQKQYVVTPDGQRFLVDAPVIQDASLPITVVLNWQGLSGREK